MKRKIYLLLYIIWNIFLILIISFGSDLSKYIIHKLNNYFYCISIPIFVNKILGHFSLFFIDGILAFLCFKEINKKNSFLTYGIGLFVAILTEFIQIFLANRNPCLADVCLDFFAYSLATLVIDKLYTSYKIKTTNKICLLLELF